MNKQTNKIMTQITLNELIELTSLISVFSGSIAAASALAVDIFRRSVQAKNAKYAASVEFERISNAVELLQSTLNDQSVNADRYHIEMRERVAHIEGRLDAYLSIE